MSTQKVVAFDGQSAITSNLLNELAPSPDTDVSAYEINAKISELELALVKAKLGFENNQPASSIVETLAGDLHLIRRSCDQTTWKQLIPRAQKHSVSEYLMQDPFTSWSFEKPRGYSGDAGLLDIYYKHSNAKKTIDATTELGREIYAYTSDAESSIAGRERRKILAQSVDETAYRTKNAEVLAVASGFLREAELSETYGSGSLKRWVALDQDPFSVETVNECYGGDIVKPVEGSVKGLLRRAYDLGTFDLIYASGLYDYLPKKIGVRLLQRMCELLKPNGEILFANFSDEITTDGYMETFMDWPLILRSADDMWEIINESIDRNEYDAEVYYGSNRNMVYAKLRKK